jgi:TP53 regulating kinase-like protein
VLPTQGAEAILTRTEFLGRPAVLKARVPKAYRHPAVDEQLRRARIVAEVRLMAEARAAGVSVPILYDIDLAENRIVMEYVEGPTAKEVLERGGPKALRTAREIGRVVGRLHRSGIAHGDLTTSNMIVRSGRIVMIDFSLGSTDARGEARGVDLHLLKEALGSAHARGLTYFRAVLETYRRTAGAGGSEAIAKISEIESRGRYT